MAFAATSLVAVGTTLASTPASAHHGDTGEYLRTSPVLIVGEVVSVESGFPHTELVVATDGSATEADVPQEFAALERSEGRELRPLLGQPTGDVRLVFDPVLTSELDSVTELRAGDSIAAVAFPRCLQNSDYDNELRVQVVRLPSGSELLRGDASVVDYVDDCEPGAEPTLPVVALAQPAPTPEPGEVRGDEPGDATPAAADDASVDATAVSAAYVILIAGVLIAGLIVGALLAVRRRRSR